MGLECSALCLLSGLEINAAFMAAARGSGKRERVEGPLVSTLSAQMGEGPVCGAAVAGLMDELLQWVRVCGGSGDEDRRRWRDWVSCRAGMVVRVFFFFSGRAVLAGVSTVLLRVDVCFYSQACIVLPELIKPK